MKIIFAIIIAVSLFGCNVNQEGIQTSTNSSEITLQKSEQFIVVRVQNFIDKTAYNSERAIYIITDRKTGVQYVGISGIGISELGNHKSGKITVSDER